MDKNGNKHTAFKWTIDQAVNSGDRIVKRVEAEISGFEQAEARAVFLKNLTTALAQIYALAKDKGVKVRIRRLSEADRSLTELVIDGKEKVAHLHGVGPDGNCESMNCEVLISRLELEGDKLDPAYVLFFEDLYFKETEVRIGRKDS